MDAGAGSEILACALLERLAQEKFVEKIELVCYENDENIISLLKENLWTKMMLAIAWKIVQRFAGGEAEDEQARGL